MKRAKPGLRTLREKRGLSQERLEALCGVSQGTISRMEIQGAPLPVLNAMRIAKALGVSLEDLFGPVADVAPTRRRRTAVHAPGCERQGAAD